jgi:hypothetical protein
MALIGNLTLNLTDLFLVFFPTTRSLYFTFFGTAFAPQFLRKSVLFGFSFRLEFGSFDKLSIRTSYSRFATEIKTNGTNPGFSYWFAFNGDRSVSVSTIPKNRASRRLSPTSGLPAHPNL